MKRRSKNTYGESFLNRNGRVNYNYSPKAAHRDNKGTYNRGSGAQSNTIRVPSLKRSNKVWNNFYRLFPHLKGKKKWYGAKLKKV